MYLNKKVLNLGLLFVIFCGFNLANAKSAPAQSKKIKVLTSYWDKYTNKDGTGVYFDLLKETIGADAFTFEMLPWKRAQTSFEKGEGDILLGEGNSAQYCKFPKWPIDVDIFSAFFNKAKFEKWPGAKNLGNLKVIWVRGYDLDKSVPGLKAEFEVDDLSQGIKMIQGGRADILVDYDQDLKDQRELLKISKEEFLILPTDITGGYIYACFHPNKETSSLIKKFDDKMDQINKNGNLLKIFTKYDRVKNYQKVIESQKK